MNVNVNDCANCYADLFAKQLYDLSAKRLNAKIVVNQLLLSADTKKELFLLSSSIPTTSSRSGLA